MGGNINPLSLRERVGVRGSKSSGFLSIYSLIPAFSLGEKGLI